MTKFLNISTDTTLGGNAPSDEIVSSQKAIKAYTNTKIPYNAVIQNLNSFNNNGKLFLSTLDNCFYSLNRRFTVTGTGFTSFNAAALFDGVFENYSYNNIGVGGTGVVTVTGTAITGTYRQGYILISFYSGRGPKAASDVTIQIENANGNVATLTPTAYSTNGLVLIAEVPTLPTANAIVKITITIVNNRASGTVNPVELEYFCTRPSNTGLLSYVSKTGNSTIYGELTADKLIRSGGTSSQFLKADGSVDSTTYAPASSVPTVNNPTITITQGGVTKGSFTLNQASGDTIALDAGGGGAVDSVNGKTGVVVLTATDVGALPDSTVIPDAQIQSDWNQADNTKVDYIKNKPTIPTVGNGTITITQGGVSKGTFTTNQSGNTTIALDSGGGSVAIDNITITKNLSDEIQTVAVIDQNSGSDKIWTGDSDGYEAIASLDSDTFYAITDDIGAPATVIAELAEGLNDKVDIGHQVIAFQEPTAANNYTWYRKYADGWVEQGGYIAGNVTNSNDATFSVNLVVQMKNSQYTLADSWGYTDIGSQNGKIALTAKTTTYFSYRTISLAGNARFHWFSWQVSGMAA